MHGREPMRRSIYILMKFVRSLHRSARVLTASNRSRISRDKNARTGYSGPKAITTAFYRPGLR